MTAAHPRPVGVAVTSSVFGGAEKCLIELYDHPRVRAEFAATLIGSMPGWERTRLPIRSMGPARKWGRGTMRREIARLPASMVRGRRALADFADADHPAFVHLSYKREQILLTRDAATLTPVIWTEHGALPRGREWTALAPFYRRAARRAAAIICVSPSVADDVSVAVGRSCPPIHVIENAIDSAHAPVRSPDAVRGARGRLGLPPNGAILASTSRLAPTKRVRLVVEAAERIPGAVALICGDGPQRAELEARAMSGRAVFTGFMADPSDVYLAADVLVHPTRGDGEGLPFSLLEAAAAGLPAVVCADSGLGALVSGWGGVASADPAAIALAVVALQGKVSQQAARTWAERHSIPPWIDAHLEVMRNVGDL